MSNYYRSLSVNKLFISNEKIDQYDGEIALSLDGNPVLVIKKNDAFINDKRILTSVDRELSYRIAFGSGIFIPNDLVNNHVYLRYSGNCDSGYDTSLRIANIYNTPFPILIKNISIQKGFSGDTLIRIPSIGYSNIVTGNFFNEDLDIEVGRNTQIYIEVLGEPTLEMFVELYVTKSINQKDSVMSSTITQIIQPGFNEIFKQTDDSIETKYSINIV
jgi:hypothetical protein